MKNQDLTKIARLLVKNKKIEKKMADQLITNLSKDELAKFSRILRTMVNKNRVVVLSEQPLTALLKEKIKTKYKDKDVIFQQEDIGDGIKLIVNDTIIDLTLEGYLNTTAQTITN